MVASTSGVRHGRASRTGGPPQGARERSGGGNQVRGDAVSYDVHPRPPLGKALTVALTALALLAGACGTGETVAERDDTTAGPTGDGGDRRDGGDDGSVDGSDGTGLPRPGDGSDNSPRIVVELGPERVSLSRDGGCWIADDGSAECWDGDDEWSQDGDFVQISAGTLFACGVTSDSGVRCWSKEHGEGFFQSWWDTKEEIPVPRGTPVRQVEVDGPHLCAVLSDGTLGCYGRKYYGIRLTVDGWENPEPGPLPSVTFTQISTGAWRDDDSTGMSCGIRSDTSTLACWNYDRVRPRPEGEYSQVSVSLGLVSGKLSVGGISISYGVGVLICGVLTDGRAECWSMDGTDQNGERIAVKYYTPDGQYLQVSAGYRYVCGLRTDGTVECWQLDRLEPSLGDGAETDAGFPPVVLDLPAGSRFTRIAVGGHGRACGTRTDGELECWTITEIEPEQPRVIIDEEDRSRVIVDEETADLVRVEGSGNSSFTVSLDAGTWVPVFSSDGEYELFVPGYQVGASRTKMCQPPFYGGIWGWTDRDRPRLMTMEAARAEAERGSAFVFGDDRDAMCEPGEYRVYVSTSDESTQWSFEFRREPVQGWGYGNAAALDRPDAEFLHIDAATRWIVDYLAEDYNVSKRVAGDSYVCGVLAEGGTQCWGSGYDDGSDPPPTEVIQISAAAGYACGLKPEGTTQCWDWVDELPANPSLEATGIVQIVATDLAICAVLGSGDVVCDDPWDLGRPLEEFMTLDHRVENLSMSDTGWTACAVSSSNEATCRDGLRGDLRMSQTPGHRFKQVSTSDRHACGILMDDSVECWNYFASDQHFDYDSNEHILHAPDGQFTQVAAGDYHTCGLRPDGTAACWGWNRFGQSTPPEGRFTQIVSTMHMSCGLRPDGSVECWGYAGEQ